MSCMLFHTRIVRYSDVLSASRDTFAKLAANVRGVTVEVTVTADGGSTARVVYTWNDARTHVSANVMMPTLQPDAVLSRAEADRMVGYVIHELGHALYSDLGCYQQTRGDALLGQVLNGLEDPRQEACIMRDAFAPGFADLIQDLMEADFARGSAKLGADTFSVDTCGALPYACAVLGRAALGHPIHALAGKVVVAPEFQDAMDHAMAGLPGCKSTDDVLKLAREVVAMARKAAQPEPQQDQPEPQQGKPCDDGDSGSSDQQDAPNEPSEDSDDPSEDEDASDIQSDSADSYDDSDSADSDSADSDSADDASDNDDAGDEAGGQGASNKLADEEIVKEADLSIEDMVRDLCQRLEAADGMDDISDWRGAEYSKDGPSVAHGAAQRARNRGSAASVPVNHYRNLVPSPMKLKDSVRRMLRSPDAIGRESFLTSGRMDRRAMSRAAAGSPNVFCRRDEVQGMNTGVMVLLDSSSSMDGSKLASAKAMALHLSEACKAAGASVCVTTFEDRATSIAFDAHGNAAHTQGKPRLTILKDWSEGLPQAMPRICGIACPNGTPLADGIMACADYFKRQPHLTRRILLALTDGQGDLGPTGTEWACKYAANRGVEVIGLCLSDSLYGWQIDPKNVGFPYGVACNGASDLTGKALGELAKALDAASRKGK